MIENKQALFAQMSLGATIITPNNRLSNQLLFDFYQHLDCVQQTPIIYEKPRCLPYQAFLRTVFNQARHLYPNASHPLLLTNLQQGCLWEQILSNQPSYPCTDGLVHEVQDAWTRCQHWHIDSHHPAFAHTPQSLQFQQWQQQFEHELALRHAITEAQLAHHVLIYPELFAITTVIWACFDDYTPQQRTLQQTFKTAGCEQHHYDLTPKPITTHQYPANDRQDECLQMIHWLKARLAAGDQRIGVVVPDLQAQEKQLQRLLQRHLPQSQFNVSLGKALIDYPLVAHALNWLTFDTQVISNHQVRLLLHSPYLAGSKTELTTRSQLMQDSKALNEALIPLAMVVQECRNRTPKLAQLLDNLTDYPHHASPKEWSDRFKARLTAFGFPGEYPLNSSTYQCFQRLMTLFDEFLQLAVVSPIMDQTQALRALQIAATSTIFQARQPTTPIQILGLLEASGCTFDSVWVSGLTDQCLPQKTNLSAFIPIDLQRNQQMPHALASRELQFARQLLQRLQHGSQSSVFSYPRLIGDMPNLPSPLIIDLPTFTAQACIPTPSAVLLISRHDDYCLPLTQAETISGGTALLANQAKCPFRAFAAHRLHAKKDPELSTGPDASERGQILHRVMELLWQRLGSQQNLHTTSPHDLEQYIALAITDALAPIIHHRPLSFPPLIQDVEWSRIKRLVTASLEWESQRPAFTIEALEQIFTIHLAGIDFRVRIDRLDNIESNDPQKQAKWVIDYKSSIPTSKPWNEERPESPQLLLYALLDETINALLFVQLKAGRMTCSGLSEETVPIKGISALKKEERWLDYQQRWHRQLTELAHEIQTGFCPPQPSRSSTCLPCEFQNLCRIE